MGAKFALVAMLFGGSLMAQQPQRPQPFRGLAVPQAYQPRTPQPAAKGAARPAKPQGTINPQAERAPVTGSSRVMYFHKPADALAVNSSPDLLPVEAQTVEPGIVPSVMPEQMSPHDARLAQAPVPTRSMYDAPAVTDSPVSTPFPPAAARSDESAPAYLPVSSPTPTPLETPTLARPPIPDLVGVSLDPYTRTSQRQDITRPLDKTDRAAATRLPARDKIFVLYDDQQLEQAIITSVKRDVYRMMKSDAREVPKDSDDLWKFPELSRLVPEGTVYHSKTSQYPPRTECFEPAYVVHRRLHFEQKNFERAGWDLGIAQPLVSSLVFYKDVLFWPHSLASGVHNCWDTSAGKCLPGSPTPFYLYPPEITVTGSIAEIGLVTATVFIFP